MGCPVHLDVINDKHPIRLTPAMIPLAVEAISPRVSYENVNEGVQVTITDVDGTHMFIVPKGNGIQDIYKTLDGRLCIVTREPQSDGSSIGRTYYFDLPKGDKGDKGDTGSTGNGITNIYKTLDGRLCISTTSGTLYYFDLPKGDAGPGVPSGGAAGQVLVKTGSEDYSTEWSNDLSTLSSSFDALAAFVNYNDISTFTLSPASVEVGNATASVTLAWMFNATPSSLTLNGVEKSVSSTGETVTATDDGTHRVKYTLATSVGTKEVIFYFYPRVYYGAAAIPQAIDSAFVTGLSNGVLTGSRSRTINVNAQSGNYIWYASPVRYGACSFKVGGFDGGFEAAQTVSVTNASGYTEDYYIYRSTNASLGSTSVVVS